MKKSILLKAFIGVAISVGVITGVVYAYTNLWSGKAEITIESTEALDSGKIEIRDIWVDRGTWEDSTNTWTVTIPRGGDAALFINLENTGGDTVMAGAFVNDTNPSPGITIAPDGYESILAGDTNIIGILILADIDAESGKLPQVTMELREK